MNHFNILNEIYQKNKNVVNSSNDLQNINATKQLHIHLHNVQFESPIRKLSAMPYSKFPKPQLCTVLDPITGNSMQVCCVEFSKHLSEMPTRTGQLAIRTTSFRISAVLL